MSDAMDQTDLMIEYASGALPEGPALVMACKMALDDNARRSYRNIEAVGGALFEALEPAELSDSLLSETMARLDREDTVSMARPSPHDAKTRDVVPHPLQQYLPADLDQLSWVSHGRGLEQCALDLSSAGFKASLLRIPASQSVPRHTHKGVEMTLVLTGGFTDESGHYDRGALAICDGAVDHSPVADPDEDCLCLTVLDAPIKMTGLIGRFVNPFLRF